ncbi:MULTISPECIES: esterase/lipase family protein [unclassified Moraxella]|uniref:esterase/lipase family protein n=1 Tax=unclassified Moraxella TaxID=2685852 RepID=UPI003AF84259
MSASSLLSKPLSLKTTLLKASLLLSPVLVMGMANASSYYNCATATGCVAVKDVRVTSDFDQTKYPIVLAHGLGGWTKMFGIADYFHGIPQDLTQNGANVFVTKTSSVNDSEVRGEQLLQQVKTIIAVTGQPKVNLIGHSHGGHDIRYVASVAPKYVASVTAVSSPEQGSKMADWVVKMVTDGSQQSGYDVNQGQFNLGSTLAIGFFNFVGGFMDLASGIPLSQIQQQDGWSAVNALTTDYTTKFNQKFPAGMPTSYCGYPKDSVVNGVRYYSFSGIQPVTTAVDPSDTVLALTATSFAGEANDGLVSRCSSRLGQVIRDDYKMNHLDSVNQVFGVVSLLDTNPLAVYRSHVNRLKQQAL